MRVKKKSIVTILIAGLTSACVAAVIPSRVRERNLQILPKDISDAKLDSIMQTYTVALGVNCRFCHVAVKNLKDSIDFASDAEPMKQNARDMMRMTIEINKTNFYFDKTQRPEYLHTVTCNTCHRGETFPED